MKQFYLLLCLLVWQFVPAQQRDPRTDRFNYESQEIIVKLKDHVATNITYNKSGAGKTDENIGSLLGIGEKVKASKVLFNEKSITASLKRKQAQKSRRASKSEEERKKNGYEEPDVISLKNIFLLELNNEQENLEELLTSLKGHPDVEFAEPNYRYSINDFKIESENFSAADLKESRTAEFSAAVVTPNDPLFPEQTYFSDVNIDQLWNAGTTGDGTQVIAILDTGIDYNHPDLKDNIWINEAELNGVEGYDDDENGYIDDIRGWNFVNTTNDPLDDNLHGTHVAGIAGAVTNNEIGIVGAAWNVKLMPVKAFQSNGMANSVNIAEGLDYAANNGATIINMSFGSSAESLTVKAALENANETSILVAAAGNDNRCIGPGKCPDGSPSSPSFPGAYDFVLGVEDDAAYSNYDQDGPIFSEYPGLWNYELKAPGTNILSTVPGGGYRRLTGTSMSTPMVAGGIALYLHQNPNEKKGVLFGNLINTSKTYVDFLAALNTEPTSELKIISAMTKDTLTGQNGNGFNEPGELIDIFPLVKNYWGFSDDVRVGIEFATEADTTKAEIITNTIAVGSISEYATLQDLTESLQIRIAENLKNNEVIRFNLTVWAAASPQKITSTVFNINVKNSVLLFGLLSQDMTLSPDKEYLVSDNLIINKDATLTILPGTTVKISHDKKISTMDNAKILAFGKKDSIISFVSEDPVLIDMGEGYTYYNNSYWKGLNLESTQTSKFEFCHFMDLREWFSSSSKNYTVSYAVISEGRFGYRLLPAWNSLGKISNSQIQNNFVDYYLGYTTYKDALNNSNVINNYYPYSSSNIRPSFQFSNGYNEDLEGNNIFGPSKSLVPTFSGTSIPVKAYLGTSREDFIRDRVVDALTDSQYNGIFDLDSVPKVPYSAAPGMVWKVLVNGKDAQDEYDVMDPIGVGNHEIQVYFNRPMDTLTDPQMSYGVIRPFTQKIISEEGSWSADGKIYTVYHEVKIGAADGINRIRVEGARDLNYMEIPLEDFRFNMLVQSAGSASSGFFATPELGKIVLEWEEPATELMEDVLGYNMYRHEALTDSTFSNPVKINETLISDLSFSDYDVEEGQKFFYQYKIMRTNFEESDFSKTVSATPLTSLLGDSNGDFGVNVLDLVQDVDYILGNNPQPFIFKAADVNADSTVNVLDIVGTVDIINSATTSSIASKGDTFINYYSKEAIGEANFYWEGDDLFVETEHAIGGFQLAFEEGFKYSIAKDLATFEWSTYKQEESTIVMLYSFNGGKIKAGKTKLLTRSTGNFKLDIEKAVVGTPKGEKLTATFSEKKLSEIEAPVQSDKLEVVKFWPNPTEGVVNLQYYLPEEMEAVVVSLYNLQGARIWSDGALKNTKGMGEKMFNFDNLSPGVYLFLIDAVKSGEIRHREAKRIIIR